MAEKVRRCDYFYFEIEDKPGETARVLGRLREANLSLLAYTSFPTTAGRGQVTVVPEKPDELQAAARAAGLRPSERKECFLVQGEDRVGAAHSVVRRLADAKINITASCGIAAGAGVFGMTIFVKPTDLAAAAKALGA
jgi:hypothetical protein